MPAAQERDYTTARTESWESVTLWQKISVAFCSPSPWVMSVDVGVRDTFVKLVEAVIFSMGSTTGRARAVAAGAWQGG